MLYKKQNTKLVLPLFLPKVLVTNPTWLRPSLLFFDFNNVAFETQRMGDHVTKLSIKSTIFGCRYSIYGKLDKTIFPRILCIQCCSLQVPFGGTLRDRGDYLWNERECTIFNNECRWKFNKIKRHLLNSVILFVDIWSNWDYDHISLMLFGTTSQQKLSNLCLCYLFSLHSFW